MIWLIYLLGIALVVIVSLAGWRMLDHRADHAAWRCLSAGHVLDPDLAVWPDPDRARDGSGPSPLGFRTRRR